MEISGGGGQCNTLQYSGIIVLGWSLTSNLQPVLTMTCDWLGEAMYERGVWRSASIPSGELCATTSGELRMPLWSVLNWDSQDKVSNLFSACIRAEDLQLQYSTLLVEVLYSSS